MSRLHGPTQAAHGARTDTQQLQELVGAIAQAVVGLTQLRADASFANVDDALVGDDGLTQLPGQQASM